MYETSNELNKIEQQLKSVGEQITIQAVQMGIEPNALRDTDGGWPMLQVWTGLANVQLARAIMRGALPEPRYPGAVPGCNACGRLRPCNGPHDCAQM